MGKLNDPNIVATIVNDLGRYGIHCLLFGGWAEEAARLCPARRHNDVDLLMPAQSFHRLDRALADTKFAVEIAGKRFAHKRAFLFGTTMVEFILVSHSGDSLRTLFWGDVSYVWQKPLARPGLLRGRRLPVTSRENLIRYRRHHVETEPWRWQNRTSQIGRRG